MEKIIDWLQAHPVTILPIIAVVFVVFLMWKTMRD